MIYTDEYNELSLCLDVEEIDLDIRDLIKERFESISDFIPEDSYITLTFDTIENSDRKNNRVVFLEDTFESLTASIRDMNWDQNEFTYIENLKLSIFNKDNEIVKSKKIDIKDDSDNDDNDIFSIIMNSISKSKKELSSLKNKWIKDDEFYLYKYDDKIYTISRGFNYIDHYIDETDKPYWNQDGIIIDPNSKNFPYERDIDIDIDKVVIEIKSTNDMSKIKSIISKFTSKYM